jgi:hypothetical protein
MKIMLLKVSIAKSNKYKQHLQSKELGLGLEQCTLVSLKRTSSSKAWTLVYNQL